MRNLRFLTMMCLTFVLVGTSCVSKKKWNELMSDKEQLDATLTKTQEQVKTLESDVATLGEEKAKLQSDFTNETNRLNEKINGIESDLTTAQKEAEKMKGMISEKDAKIGAMTSAVQTNFSPFTSKGLELQAKNGGVYLANAVHFKSGSTRLTSDSKTALQGVIDALMANTGSKLLVEGHTDDVPMKEGAVFGSNQQLSVARANSVVRFLVKKGVSPTQLIAVGHGAEQPAMDYEQAEDKAAAREHNRRAEFAVVADTGKLLPLVQGSN